MTQRHLSVPIPGCEPATLPLPEPLTLETLARLEDAIDLALRHLRHDLRPGAADPGSIEVDSWNIHLH